MKSLSGLVFFILFSLSSYCQNYIVLRDAADSLLIANALIKITDNSGLTKRHLTDLEGKVSIEEESFPIIIRAEHFAFYSLTDTLEEKANYLYHLRYKHNQLAEVLITSSLLHQPKRLSPFRITIIDSVALSTTQSTNLQEALRAQVNIRISRDANLSSGTASMMGIGGNNVKILQDGIPVSGHTGQEIDISQIPVQEISKIEIIDGPMSVEYGTNAQMGLINLISKNNFTKNTLLQFNVTEQSVENKFGTASGIHNWNIYANIPLSKRFSTNLSLTRNYFGGATGISTGRNIDWDPRTLYSVNSIFEYRFNRLRLRFNNRFLNDEIENLGNVSGLYDPSAIDDNYITNRNSHIVKGTYSTDDIAVDGLFNFSYYRREKTTNVYNINTGENTLATFDGANDTTELYTFQSKASIIKTYTDQFLIKFGFDIQNEIASGGRIAENVTAKSSDAAVFIISEIKVNQLLLRPGLRLDYNSKYSSPGVPSLHVRYNFKKTILKASYSKGFRAPSLKEMYFEFKDINHNIIGNEELDAERSDYGEISVTQLFNNSNNKNQIQFGFKGYLTSVENLITYSQSIEDPTVLTLLNVGKYKARGLSFTGRYVWKRFNGTFQTEYLERNFQDDLTNDYHGSFALSNTNSFIVKKDKLNFNVIYTYRGKEPVLLTSLGSATNTGEVGNTEAYQLFDANLQYTFNRSLKGSFGVKNLFDKRYISSLNASLHSSGSTQLVSFGRSVVLQLSYNIINKSNKK